MDRPTGRMEMTEERVNEIATRSKEMIKIKQIEKKDYEKYTEPQRTLV